MISEYISKSNSILNYMDPISAISGSWQFINIAIQNYSKPFYITIFNFDIPQIKSDKTFAIVLNYLSFGKICKPCAFGSSLQINSENPLRCKCSPCKLGYTGKDCKLLITQLNSGNSVSKDIHRSEPLFFKIKNEGIDIILTLKEITFTNGITMYVQYESEIGCIAGKINNYYDANLPLRMLITPQQTSRVINHKNSDILLTFQNTANSLSSFSVNFKYRTDKNESGIEKISLIIGLSLLGGIIIILISCKVYRTIKLRSIVINSKASSSKQNRRSFTQDQIERLFPEVTAESVYEDSTIIRKDQSNLMQCPICFDTIRKNQLVRITQCRHSFHSRCLAEWLNSSSKCPNCQSILEIEQIQESKSQYQKSQHQDEQPQSKTNINQNNENFSKRGITILEEKQINLFGQSQASCHLKIQESFLNDDQITQL